MTIVGTVATALHLVTSLVVSHEHRSPRAGGSATRIAPMAAHGAIGRRHADAATAGPLTMRWSAQGDTLGARWSGTGAA